MIKHISLFIVGLVFVAMAVVVRHGDPDLVTWLPAFLLNPKVWIVFGGFFFGLSFIPFKPAAVSISLDEVLIDGLPLPQIGVKLAEIVAVSPPDIPLLVDFVVYQAICHEASDIHFDPSQNGMAVKFRVQGMMKTVGTVPNSLRGPVTNRLKILSNLIIYKDMTPQDGRFDSSNSQSASMRQRQELQRSGLDRTDFRIAFMPTLHGERIVIRILDTATRSTDLKALGFAREPLELLRRQLAQPQGMIILTGPTGSGKTTTIFAALQEIVELSAQKRSVATLEDPIEFDCPDINQSQVDEERGFSFHKGLRAILRQDPDVIMVGEIRDTETAKIALQAGMTGHLLITTVHASSSAAAFARLTEMGIPAYSLNSAVTAVIAQRLVRTICPHCKTQRSVTPADAAFLGDDNPSRELELYLGVGCEACEDTGYKGRTAIYEILEMTEGIRTLISNGVDSDQIYREAKKNGMKTLWESGIEEVLKGNTTFEELERAISVELQG